MAAFIEDGVPHRSLKIGVLHVESSDSQLDHRTPSCWAVLAISFEQNGAAGGISHAKAVQSTSTEVKLGEERETYTFRRPQSRVALPIRFRWVFDTECCEVLERCFETKSFC